MTPDKKKYYYGTGRRKEAVARVRLYEGGTGKLLVNGKESHDYFSPAYPVAEVVKPMTLVGKNEAFDVTVKVSGGGKEAQVEALRLGIARALQVFDVSLRATLKKAGYLRRDPRMKERKKPGLKRARKRPQWSKR